MFHTKRIKAKKASSIFDQSQSTLATLPPELLLDIYGNLPNLQDAKKLSCCKSLYQFFQPHFLKLKTKQTIDDIFNVNQTTVIQLIDSSPEILFLKTETKQKIITPDQTYEQSFKYSPFQIMFIIGDTALIQAIRPYVQKIEDGKNLATKQLLELKEQRKKQKKITINFEEVAEAITNTQFSDHSMHSLDQKTNTAIAKCQKDIIDHVLNRQCLDLQLLVNTLETYNEHCEAWKHMDTSSMLRADVRKNMLYLCRIFGLLEYVAPKWFIHMICNDFFETCKSENEHTLISNPTFKLTYGAHDFHEFQQITHHNGRAKKQRLGLDYYACLHGTIGTDSMQDNYAQYAIGKLTVFIGQRNQLLKKLEQSFSEENIAEKDNSKKTHT